MGRPRKSAPVLHEPEDDFNQEAPEEEPARVIDEEEPEAAPEGNGSISKARAVRNAVAEGLDDPTEIANFARKHYGLEIANQQVSAYKSQAKARARKAGGEATHVAEEHQPESNGHSGASKTDLIREALEAGHEKPARGVAYIREKHGVEIDAKYYSIVKGKLGKAASQEEAPEPKAKPEPARSANRTEAAQASAGTIPAGLFDDLKQLRELKDRYGDDFQRMVEAIG